MKRIVWEPGARADLRRIDQPHAIELLRKIAEYATTGHGEVRNLADDKLERYRLRVGDWRILFRLEKNSVLRIWSVVDRKDPIRALGWDLLRAYPFRLRDY